MSDATGLALGIDIGGSGIKGAPVDLMTGRLATDRLRIDTPQPSTPRLLSMSSAPSSTPSPTRSVPAAPSG